MRGLKLNFMYMQVKRPPRMSESNEWLGKQARGSDIVLPIADYARISIP
jgi:hypothetical protein